MISKHLQVILAKAIYLQVLDYNLNAHSIVLSYFTTVVTQSPDVYQFVNVNLFLYLLSTYNTSFRVNFHGVSV